MSFLNIVLRGDFTEETARKHILNYCLTPEDKFVGCRQLISDGKFEGFVSVMSQSLFEKMVREDQNEWSVVVSPDYYLPINELGFFIVSSINKKKEVIEDLNFVLESLSAIGAIPGTYKIRHASDHRYCENYLFVNFFRPLNVQEFSRCKVLIDKQDEVRCNYLVHRWNGIKDFQKSNRQKK